MTSLGKWQFVSFLSRGLATLFGLIQSFVIIRLLTVSEWGVVQLAISIGGALGIYQNLGLASASTREISSAKNDKDIFKIFVTSVLIRYCVTLPIFVGLFFFADRIALNIYKNSNLIIPLKIYAVTLLFQSVQSILNSIVMGTKRFKRLFLYQVLISLISIIVYLPLVYLYKINGYFYAFISFNIISTLILGYLALNPLKGSLEFPSLKDFKKVFKELFSISMAIYVVKILATNWEKLGPNILGVHLTPELVAVFAFATLYSRKILSISDAVTDVSLPVLSEKFETNISDFKDTFIKNFNKIFFFIMLSASAASYWAPQIISILVGKEKYISSVPLIPPLLFGYIIYSFIDILKSSVLVPAKMVKELVISYALILLFTVVSFFTYSKFFSPQVSMSIGMVSGVLVSFSYLVLIVNKKLKMDFFTIDHAAILVQGFSISLLCNVALNPVKLVAFPIFMGLIVWSFIIPGYLTKSEIISIRKKLFRI